ncbi:copper homeostasis protein CutC [Catenuloplanes atrovinosus]|uniref:Copper homeostasis protein cutC homolog n=1 Tax=Catenuloplanes atrovinosus TaxID=137266 RepID=A0AAE3YLE0_9ACTN|nr:copper homeostasis protein CutC [Catenuloplanes atrovinosus]MDR7275092.1 copper homeostasis protein [Catenuloplanes atrovinosus]
MSRPLLEVIALGPADARRAADAGADRIELVSDMDAGGLTPDPATVEAVCAAVDIPVRVMLRDRDGFAPHDLTALRHAAKAVRGAGAAEFVLGFLSPAGDLDLPAVCEVLDVLDGAPWTFHRAIDHATDRAALWASLRGLPGLDCVLTAGGPAGVADGLSVLAAEAAAGVPVLAGGGLRRPHLAPLRAAGVTAFHTGGAVRPDGRWDLPVDASLVAAWRTDLS